MGSLKREEEQRDEEGKEENVNARGGGGGGKANAAAECIASHAGLLLRVLDNFLYEFDAAYPDAASKSSSSSTSSSSPSVPSRPRFSRHRFARASDRSPSPSLALRLVVGCGEDAGAAPTASQVAEVRSAIKNTMQRLLCVFSGSDEDRRIYAERCC